MKTVRLHLRPNRTARSGRKRRDFRDLALGLVGGGAAALTVLVLGWIVFDLLRAGLPHLSWRFLFGEVEDSGRAGGIGPVLLSTLAIVALALAVALPLGVGAALWLSDCAPVGSRRGRLAQAGVDALASVPSIVFGLFGLAFFCRFLGFGFSILSGALTLALMILPLLVLTTRAALSSLPGGLRPAAAALGLTRATTVGRILLPAALPGILVGSTLGVARALAETAALLFTSGYATRWPASPLDSGRALSVHLYDLAMNVPGAAAPAAASALVLLLLVLLVNALASALATAWTRRLSHA
jgi:phosphate transport system permease protein